MTNIVAFRPAQLKAAPALANRLYEPADIVHVNWGPIAQQSQLTTEAALNLRLRKQRRTAWASGMARLNYYKAALDMEHAIHRVQHWEVPEARNHSRRGNHARMEILSCYRAALVDQILRPAPRRSDVEWKRRQVAASTFKYCGLSEDLAQRAISEDMAFLDAHPVRRAKCS